MVTTEAGEALAHHARLNIDLRERTSAEIVKMIGAGLAEAGAGPHVTSLDPPASLMRWLTAHVRRACRYGSIFSGAFLLVATCWTGEDLGVVCVMGERG